MVPVRPPPQATSTRSFAQRSQRSRMASRASPEWRGNPKSGHLTHVCGQVTVGSAPVGQSPKSGASTGESPSRRPRTKRPLGSRSTPAVPISHTTPEAWQQQPLTPRGSLGRAAGDTEGADVWVGGGDHSGDADGTEEWADCQGPPATCEGSREQCRHWCEREGEEPAGSRDASLEFGRCNGELVCLHSGDAGRQVSGTRGTAG